MLHRRCQITERDCVSEAHEAESAATPARETKGSWKLISVQVSRFQRTYPSGFLILELASKSGASAIDRNGSVY